MPKHLSVASAGESELSATSESEEMYLITVARAVEAGQPEPVPMPEIAGSLSVSIASANEMVRKLATRGLMSYEPYRGAGLTTTGRAIATRVLRTRRLWATFLADHLGYSPAEADERACHLEHVTGTDAAERLAAYLGDPTTDPLGHPIPAADAFDLDTPAATLDTVAVGSAATVLTVRAPRPVADFLAAEGITAGRVITVLATGQDGILLEADHPVHVTRDLAATIDVRSPDGR